MVAFFDRHLQMYGKQFLFLCNYCDRDALKIPNVFIQQVVSAWCKSSFYVPTNNYGNQILWNNSHIRVADRTVFYPNLYDNGVKYVRDLFDEDGNSLSFESLKAKFNLAAFPFTRYLGILHSIPLHWRHENLYNDDTPNENILWYRKVMNSPSISQAIYSNYLQKIAQVPTAKRKWEDNFSDVSNENWKQIYKAPWCSVNEARIIYFQFKFIHRIVPTNRLLNLMGILDSPLCTFCEIHDESLEHLFWDCPHTSSFILDTESRLLNTQFFFSKKDFFFGYTHDITHPYIF